MTAILFVEGRSSAPRGLPGPLATGTRVANDPILRTKSPPFSIGKGVLDPVRDAGRANCTVRLLPLDAELRGLMEPTLSSLAYTVGGGGGEVSIICLELGGVGEGDGGSLRSDSEETE
eukprot:CAMPEP_0184337732 /NCGR_PEP_ID=MMETSP1089-20130417/6176_1 /TAXON_ID=38269 ORGANISM="Gloeochaete wittrockiana, Strain SAG46.84" /NCGR_SAMPLE_ID=MMETSP1089 /ASSEMBLY_ACC=CAM_ASM_000445 /LENGTH=117 /DNA_ID=CAMNT_0026663717 /DNA_START=209 /DNA_END=563 /DNA_ORIENTATION=-